MFSRELAVILLLISSGVAFGQAADTRIETIRNLYADANARIAEMKKNPAESSIFAVEIVVNKYSAPYPAVGIYRRTATFYYTYGDRERNPYPDRLVKIETEGTRSAQVENTEILFNNAGELIFMFRSTPGSPIEETRSYFSGGSLIRLIDDGKNIGLRTKRAVEAGTAARKESARLVGIFQASLID